MVRFVFKFFAVTSCSLIFRVLLAEPLLDGADFDYGEYLSGQCVTCHQSSSDEGIPAINGRLDESLADIVFGDSNSNIQTLEASIMRAQLTQKMSETKKLNFSMTLSSFEKMYQNLYASGYDGT